MQTQKDPLKTLIVIEGADNVGKSSLARALSADLKAPISHFTAPPDAEAAKYRCFSLLHSNKDHHYELLILDRSWIGEFVYGPLLRSYSPGYFAEAEAAVKENNWRVLYILLHAPEETMRSFPAGKNGAKLLGMHQRVSAKFVEVFNQIKSGEKFIFDVSHFSSHADLLMEIRVFVQKWLNHGPVFRESADDYRYSFYSPKSRFSDGGMMFPTVCGCPYFKDHQKYGFWQTHHSITWGCGSLTPKYIFVGEAPGHNGCGKLGIPFYRDASGTMFREAMFWNRVLDTEIYMTNVLKCTPANNKIDDRPIKECAARLDLEFLAIFGKKFDWDKMEKLAPVEAKIIAVGKTAYNYLHEHTKYAKYPVKYLVHPAFLLYRGIPRITFNVEFRRCIE